MLQKMGWEWLEDITTAEGIYAATRYAAAKMLKSGTTTVCELVEGPNALPGRARREREGHRRGRHPRPARLRGDRADPGRLHPREGSTPRRPRRPSRRTCACWSGTPRAATGGSRRAWACTPPSPTPSPRCSKARQIADERKCGIQIHVAEIPRAFLVEKYGKSAPQVLEEQGVLGPRRDGGALHRPHRRGPGDPAPERGERRAHAHDQLPGRQRRGPGSRHARRGHERHTRPRLLLHPWTSPSTSATPTWCTRPTGPTPALLPPFQALDMVLGNAARALGLGTGSAASRWASARTS